MESPERVELPAAFEDVDVDILVQLIADMMERLMAHNDQIPLLPESLTRFHSRTAPAISILEYLRRIVKFTKAERTCLLLTLYYIDQISVQMPHFVLTSLTCHRFVIAAIVVSSKCFCDVFSSNSIYAKVGGIPLAELNMLEREFLKVIKWNLTSKRQDLQEYYVNLVRTFSRGGYVIADAQSSSSSLSDSDADMDYETSAPASPAPAPTPQPHPASPRPSRKRPREPSMTQPSAVLVDAATRAPGAPPPPPTLEQNMAFAALRQEQQAERGQAADATANAGADADMDTSGSG